MLLCDFRGHAGSVTHYTTDSRPCTATEPHCLGITEIVLRIMHVHDLTVLRGSSDSFLVGLLQAQLSTTHVLCGRCEQPAGGSVEKGSLQCFEVGARVEELLHPDFSQWPRRAKRGEPERAARMYRPIPLQTLGNSKVPLEHAFKSLMNQICDAGAGEYVFLRCAFCPHRHSVCSHGGS